MKKIISIFLALTVMFSCMLGQFTFATAAGETIDYSDAPYAGVYAVVSDVDTTVTTEIGSVAELAAGDTGYIYLAKGANEVEITNDATLTITDLDDNGLSYIDQVNVPTQPIIKEQEDSVAKGLYKNLAPGDSYTVTYTPSLGMNGMVYAYLYFSDTVENDFLVTTDGGFKTIVHKPAGYQSTMAWKDAARAEISLLYVKAGANEITITNIGQNTGTLTNINIHSIGEYSEAITIDQLEVMTYAELNPTPEPTPTPTPEPTPSIYTDTFTYKAEDAGVYEVTADAEVVIENETGSKAELTAGVTKYIYLIKGVNNIATTNLDANVTFTALENNGLDYINDIEVGSLPIPEGDSFVWKSGIGAGLEPGESYTFIFDTDVYGGWSGLVHPYIYLNDGNAVSIEVKTDTGFYAELSKSGYANTLYETAPGNKDLEILYLREGKNVISIINTGSNATTIANISINSLSSAVNDATWGPQCNLANLKPYTGDAPVYDYGYFPEGWDGVVENHPDYNADAEALYIDGAFPNMSSEDGMELLGTDWGSVGETGDVITKGATDGIYLPAGSSATYTLNNIPTTGTYAVLVRYGQASYTTASLQLINNVDGVDYYAQYNIAPGGAWTSQLWSYNNNYDDFLYFQEGTNELTVYNAGPGGIVFNAFDLLLLNNTDDYLQYVGTADNTEGTNPAGWNGTVVGWEDWDADNGWTYGVTLASTYNSIEYYPPYTEAGMNLSDDIWVNYTVTAPAAGMYLVEADYTGTLRLQTEIGDFAEFTAEGAPMQYIYLSEGDNIITATGGPGTELRTAMFYQLNNSDDYLSQRDNVNIIPEEPFEMSLSPFKDMTDSSGYWYKYEYDTNGDTIVQGAGSVVKYELQVYHPGIYRVQAKIGGTTNPDNLPIITIDTDGADGYRALLATDFVYDAGAWRATDSEGNYQYVYLKEGINHIEVTAAGTHHVLWGVEFKLLTEEEKATITMDDCKLTPPRPITINPFTDSILENQNIDYYTYHAAAPVLGSGHGTELVSGEWQRFEVEAKAAGAYQITTLAATYSGDSTISVETEDSIAYTEHTATGDGIYYYRDGGYVTLKEGVNSVWVRNDGPGYMYLKSITLTYAEDAEILPGAFIQAHRYIGAAENAAEIPEYTVRGGYYGIHVANNTDTAANTLTYQYNVSIPADDDYGIIMTGTVPLTPNIKITMSDGVNEDIVMMDGEPPYFGNQDQSNSVTITPEKVYLPAGEYTMTFQLTENVDAGSDSMMMTHVHSFEFTTLTRQDMFLVAMQNAASTDDIKAAFEEFHDVITTDISLTPETDFIYPEYAYNALLSAAMLPSGSYETYEDVKTAYDFAKNMISYADDGTGNLVYTVQVGDWNPVGTTVIVAVYTGNQLYMIGEGYLDYAEATGSYIPVEATLYDYIPEDGDEIKVFVWDSFDGLTPVF